MSRRSLRGSLRSRLLATVSSQPLSLAVLAGCQVQVRESDRGPWMGFHPGGTLTLNRVIPVPRDRARVFFLDGQLRSTGASLGPSCGIEIRTLPRDGPHAIPAGAFRIARVQPYWTQVAARIPAGAAGAARLWLADGPDPDVMRLTCLGMLDEMWRARPPTLVEIRAALGDLATLELPANRPR